jgi:hypothetical protein
MPWNETDFDLEGDNLDTTVLGEPFAMRSFLRQNWAAGNGRPRYIVTILLSGAA